MKSNKMKPMQVILQGMVTRIVTHIDGVTHTPIHQDLDAKNLNMAGMRLRLDGIQPTAALTHQLVVNVEAPSKNGGLHLKPAGLTDEAPSAYLVGLAGNWRLAGTDLNTANMGDYMSRLSQSSIVLSRDKSEETPGVTILMKEDACLVATNTDTRQSFVIRARNGEVELLA